MKTKSMMVVLGLVLMMSYSVTPAFGQFLPGSTRNAWGEPTDSQGRVVGARPVACNTAVTQPVAVVLVPPTMTRVAGQVRQVQQPVIVAQPQPVKRSVWSRIFSPPAEPEVTVRTEAVWHDAGNHYVRTERTTVDRSRFPDHLAPLALQSRLPDVQNKSATVQTDFGNTVRSLDVEKRGYHHPYRYINERGELVTTVVTTQESMAYESAYTYQQPPPEIISVPTATAGRVEGNPPGVLIIRALVTPPPKKQKR